MIETVLTLFVAIETGYTIGFRDIAACDPRAYVRPRVQNVAPPMPSIPPLPVAGPPRKRPFGDMRLPEGGTNTEFYIEYVKRQRALEFNIRRNQ